MPLMPKRVKFRKSQRGKVKGNASRGNAVTFGEFAPTRLFKGHSGGRAKAAAAAPK